MKKILIVAIIFAMLAPLASCTQKTHFKFEKIKNAYFREKTQFFALNNLIYVIDRDKLVCMDPETGDMLESVNLPGYPVDMYASFTDLDLEYNFSKNHIIFMLFSTQDGYFFKEFRINGQKPFISSNGLIKVDGSKFESVNYDVINDKWSLVLFDSKTNSISSYKDFKLIDEISFKKNVIFKDTPIAFVVYDGAKVTYARIDEKGKIIYPYKYFIPADLENKRSGVELNDFDIPAKDFSKSFIVDSDSEFSIYDGSSFNDLVPDIKKLDDGSLDPIERYKIGKKEYPGILGYFDGFVTTDKGLFYYKSNMRVSDSKYIIVDKNTIIYQDNQTYSRDLYLGILQLDNKTKVACFLGDNFDFIENKIDSIKEYTFDYLPGGVSDIKLVQFDDRDSHGTNYQFRVYAFTSEGLFRSEVIAESYLRNP